MSEVTEEDCGRWVDEDFLLRSRGKQLLGTLMAHRLWKFLLQPGGKTKDEMNRSIHST